MHIDSYDACLFLNKLLFESQQIKENVKCKNSFKFKILFTFCPELVPFDDSTITILQKKNLLNNI